MSSGVPSSILAATSVNQSVQYPNQFAHFGYLFSGATPAHPSQQFQQHPTPVTPNNRFKVKRHRQRVDAGEPRNTYQGTSSSSAKKIALSMNMLQVEPTINNVWGSTTTENQETTQEGSEESVRTIKEEVNGEDDVKGREDAEEEETATIESQQEAANGDDFDFLEDLTNQEEDQEREDSVEKEEITQSRESPSSTSSASKRKSFQPQKIGEQLGIDMNEEPERINISVGAENEEEDGEEESEQQQKPIGLSALQAQLSNPLAAHALFETQKKVYAAFIEQHRKKAQQNQNPNSDKNEEKKINYEQLVHMLKSEVFDNLTQSIEKIVKNWAVSEAARQEAVMAAATAAAAAAAAASTSTSAAQPMTNQPFVHPIFPHPNALAAFQLHHNPHQIGGGIFPPTINAFNQLQAFNALRRNLEDEGMPKKKRVKVWETKQQKEQGTRTGTPISTPASPPLSSTPNLNRYFPPTMVGHPLFGGVSFGQQSHHPHNLLNDREDSPTNSDETSEYGGYEGSGDKSALNSTHLKKAKLMFFYTRYPNSNLLKSYFPDIRFNKNNTAQLVKWFSNFREFYYIQMEKYGRQLLAEGIQSRDDIIVTKDSELFKCLNTHYNRNNHIQAPDRLVVVVQETLREFFDAIRLGKDIEPSWKKTIYKIINRMDDPIPDFFKEPDFLDRLEREVNK